MNTSRRWWIFAIVSLALFMGALDNLVVTTALPAIQRALHANLADLEWTVNAYTLVFTILMIPAAALGDRFGHKRMLLVGVGLFTLGSTLSALSSSALMLALARGLQGLGGACITPLTLTILTRAFPSEQRALIIGLWSGISGLGLTIGPLVGGAIVNGWNWGAVFWINVPLGIVLLVLGQMRLPESYGDRRPLDLPAILLIGTSLLCIIFGVSNGNALGWSSLPVVGTLLAGAILMLTFLMRERTTAAPMIDLNLFAKRDFTVSNSIGFLMSFGMFGAVFFVTQFIQDVLRVSPLVAGQETMPWTASIMLVAPLSGLLSRRMGTRLIILIGMLAQAVALAWIGLLATTTTPYIALLPAFILAGLGMGFTFGPISSVVMNAVSSMQQGQASSISNTLRELGGVFGIALLSIVFGQITSDAGVFVSMFRATVLVGASIVAVGGLLTLLLPRAVPVSSTDEVLQEVEERSAA